jgi:hypothetical protein
MSAGEAGGIKDDYIGNASVQDKGAGKKPKGIGKQPEAVVQTVKDKQPSSKKKMRAGALIAENSTAVNSTAEKCKKAMPRSLKRRLLQIVSKN